MTMPESDPTAARPDGAYAKTTRAITVSVQPTFLRDQSTPEEGHFVWAYHVRIENHSNRAVPTEPLLADYRFGPRPSRGEASSASSPRAGRSFEPPAARRWRRRRG
jgi:ApaG protein